MSKIYLAHSAKNGHPAQSYKDHVENTTKLALRFAQEMKTYCRKDAAQLDNILCLAASCHDLGKLDERNQSVLRGEVKERHLAVNHVDAGAAFLKQYKQDALLSLRLVSGHHQGLFDESAERNRSDAACFRDEHPEVRQGTDQELDSLLQIHRQLIPEQSEHTPEYCVGDPAVLLRMLMSCLADADHSDTAAVYGHQPDFDNVPELQPELRLAALDRYVADLYGENSGKHDELREQMYKECRNYKSKSGIIFNDGPAGSGKTTAVMAFQLKQAASRKARRIFAVLPYTNTITPSVETYRKALVLPGEDPELVVAEMHSKADFESQDTRYLTALWRAPIIVTTAAAFFETLASNRPGALRRLHELPGSIIFADAALPLKLLPLAWHWMNVLEEDWSCCWIVASGSLVKFWQIPELIKNGDRQVPAMISRDLHRQLLTDEKSRIKFCCNPHPLSRKN